MTVFGPGVGECIVLHLGNDEWVIIDSCIFSGETEPVALTYLKRIGVDPATSVRLIVATHFDDDHIRGMAKLLSECTSAEFAMSAALELSQFCEIVSTVNTQLLVKHTSGASEFAEIFQILIERKKGKFVGGFSQAQDGMVLFRGSHSSNIKVCALSPSADTITNAMTGLAKKLLTAGDIRRFKALSPNDISVAVHIESDTFNLLLGADLENSASPQFGWKAVLSSKRRSPKSSHAFKIPHHGSDGADHADVWTSMLHDNTIAIVTPFIRKKEPIPTDADVDRMKKNTTEAFCTTWPHSVKPPRRRGVDGIMGAATKTRRAMSSVGGYVRLRFDLNAPLSAPDVQLFGKAKRL